MSTAIAHAGHLEEHRDPTGSRLGMWLFLVTELLLFGGIFLLYAVYRSTFPEDFHFAATELDTLIGGINTLILLTSSLTMVLSIAALERNRRREAVIFLVVTIVMGLAFLVIKGFEWGGKIGHGIFPGSAALVDRTPGENIFFGLYFGMTGLHALHVIVGLSVLGWMLKKIFRRMSRTVSLPAPGATRLALSSADGSSLWEGETSERVAGVEITLTYHEDEELQEKEVTKLENAGLYWHLVDIIWIFLFPLLYLIT
ncbi:cytochrome c oxidase subunit 3 [Gemmatimonadota bacterium]